jgi:GT2 family glycosyltransferase
MLRGVGSISVVVPTFNRPDSLPRVVDALARQDAEFELIVVEDAKNTATVDISGAPYPARVLEAEQPGASHARNTGWRAAAHPVVLFLGDDIIPSPELVARHAALHDQHPGDFAGALGRIEWARELGRSPFMIWLDSGIQFNYGSITDGRAGPGHFYSSNVSVKRAALEQVGGFDADHFPFLYEDIDLGARLFERGFELFFDPEAVGEHLHRPDLERWKQRMLMQARAEREWMKRHPDEQPYFLTRFEAALRMRRRRGGFRFLAPYVPRTTPVIGHRVWRNTDVYFRQQLGRPFVDEWYGTTSLAP